MESKKSLSIIVPIYNVSPVFLEECVNSLLVKHNNIDYEILLIDDCSTNGIDQVCKKYQDTYTQIKYIKVPTNMGVSNARNVGMQNAKYEWIMFVDSDDWIDDSFYDFFVKSDFDDADIAIFNCYISFKEKLESNKCLQLKDNEYMNDYENLVKQIVYKKAIDYCPTIGPGVVWGKVYRRDFLLKTKVQFNITLQRAEDHVFNLQLIEHFPKIKYYDSYLYYYRKNINSTVNGYNKSCSKKFSKTLIELKKEVDYFEKEHGYDLSDAFHYRCVKYIIASLSNDIFHPDNNLSNTEKKNDFSSLLENDLFSSALKKIDLKKYRIKSRLKIFFVKTNQFTLCKMLCQVSYAKKKFRMHA